MSKRRYLVVHPKLVLGEPLSAGQEVELEEAHAQALVSSGKLKLVVAEEPKPTKKKLTNGAKSKRQRSTRNKAE